VRIRPLLILTALLSSLLGAVVAYLVLTVPNDVQAGTLLKQARAELQRGDGDRARQSLARVVQQYPRTDAAAAAAVALSTLEASERQQLAHQVDTLKRTVSAQTLRLDEVLQKLNAPPPPPPPPPPRAASPTRPADRCRSKETAAEEGAGAV
jgi:hypothetical protein